MYDRTGHWKLELLLFTLAFTIILLATRWGIGLNGDSAAVLSATRNLLWGQGLTVSPNTGATGASGPLTHFPPLFSLLLAVVGLLGIDATEGARWMNSVLFLGNCALAARLVWTVTGSYWTTILGSLLFPFSFPLIYVHANAWTEPLLIFFGFSGLLFLGQYCQTRRRLHIVEAAGALALASLARYAGLAFVLSAIIGLLFVGPGTRCTKARDSLLLGTMSLAPVGAWFVRNVLATGLVADRGLILQPVGYHQFYIGLAHVAGWLLPTTTPRIFRAEVAVLTLACVALVCWKALRDGSRAKASSLALGSLLAIFSITFVLFLITSMTFIDASTWLDTRMLSPAYFAILILSIASLAHSVQSANRRFTLIGVTLSVALGAILILRGTTWLAHQYSYGDIFAHASPEWQNSIILEQIKHLPPDTPIYTNDQVAVYLFAGRQSYKEPQHVHPRTGQPDPDFSQEFAIMIEDLAKSDGVLVFFNAWQSPSEDDLRQRLPLMEWRRGPEGVIYRLSASDGLP